MKMLIFTIIFYINLSGNHGLKYFTAKTSGGKKIEGGNMDNFRRGLHSYLGAAAKTSLGVCLTELKH